jgi:hypothetical protein
VSFILASLNFRPSQLVPRLSLLRIRFEFLLLSLQCSDLCIVWLQLFNEVNARRPEKLNVFEGIYKNYLFMSIIFITVVFQVCTSFLSSFSLWKVVVFF